MGSSCLGSARSNLGRFLDCVTPIVPSQTLPQIKSCLHNPNGQWQPSSKGVVEYFTLGDLWDCYAEWSAYGVGIPVRLKNSDIVTQYYVPYLSAIQIYTTKPVDTSRNQRDNDSVVEFECDSWSDDSGSANLSRTLSNNSTLTWDGTSDDSSFDQDGSYSLKEKFGYLSFQYMETSSPYWRVPLMNKVSELARDHPALRTLKSIDLCPASWMAISWYPIYHIPSGKTEKDLLTRFLTYHSLSPSFQADGDDGEMVKDARRSHEPRPTANDDGKKNQTGGGITLPTFGLVTYKMRGNIWLKPESSAGDSVSDLYKAADSWLKKLGVQHHDFNFFTYARPWK